MGIEPASSIVSVKYLPQLVARRERSVNEADKLSTDVGFDVLLYGELNHITFLRRLRCCVGGPCGGGLNST